jgi:hypothetical protein
MSTTYLNNSRVAAALFMRPVLAQPVSVRASFDDSETANKEGIDLNLFKIGIFCFMIPTMFITATLGLDYLSIRDIWSNILPVSGAFIAARIATAFVIKKLAAEKNTPALVWMSAGVIAPAFSLILMSLFGNAIGQKKAASQSDKRELTELKVAAINMSPVVNINQNRQAKVIQASASEGIDQNLLKVGFFCFMIPTMFMTAAFGLEYIDWSDVWANILPVSAAFVVARIATALVIKGMASEKNRSELLWMMTALVAPALSLMLMSFFRTLPGQTSSTASKQSTSMPAELKNLHRAREINLYRSTQAA